MNLWDRINYLRAERSIEIIGELDPHWDRGLQKWVLDAPIQFVWIVSGWQVVDFTVPTDYATDLSTIPRWARSLIPQIGPQNRPSVGHDYVCDGLAPGVTRFEGDLMFLDGMKLDGVNWLRRWVMFGAVELRRIELMFKGGK